jgi:threonine aldolase
MSDMIDLRSDTVTKPTAAMREAMATAEVGDDVYGEDPTVNALEARVAAAFGHEAGLFVPSGSMGNQTAIQTLVAPASELLCDADAHVVTYEIGAAAALGGISTRTWGPSGADIDPARVAAMVRPAGYHAVATRAIAVEQTHNRAGGAVIPLSTLQTLRSVADEHGLFLHCDGARIWNAHVATGVPLATYGALFETLSVCLSKGLGAPIGSVLVSTAERVTAGRVIRKRLGGGMRQAGILAAAGLYALDHHIERLADDHARARRLAEALAPFGVTDAQAVPTNIVLLDFAKSSVDAATFAGRARQAGILVSVLGPNFGRLITHLDVTDADIDRAVEILPTLLR